MDCVTNRTDMMVRVESHLKQIMDARQLTRRRVAEGSGLNYQTVSKWYNNQIKRPDPMVIRKLAVYLGVDDHTLYSLVDDETSEGTTE